MKGQLYSVLSGLFASGASLSGKLAMGSEESLWFCEMTTSSIATIIDQSSRTTTAVLNNFPSCNTYLLFVRAGFFALTVLFNVFMWTTFVKALRHSSTSLEATVINTAANFLFTAIFGQVLFGEFLSLMWWIGTVLIIFGLLLMHNGNQQATSKLVQKRKRRS